MTDTNFEDLFGETGADGRRPTICAATERRLRKTDHVTRQRITGTKFYVLHAYPLSSERLAALTKMAGAGVKAAGKSQPKGD